MNTALKKNPRLRVLNVQKEDQTVALVRKAAEKVDGIEKRQEELDSQHAELRANLQATEQVIAKMANLAEGFGGGFSAETAGQIFIKSDEFSSLQERGRGTASVTIKSTLTLDPASAGDLVTPTRVPGATMLQQRRIRIRDVLAAGRTDSSSVEFVKQVTRTNAATTVAELGLKPEAALTFDLQTAPVRTIAVTLPASRQIMSDAPMLASLVDSELRYMLQDVEELQLLNGNGSGSNILGIVPQATAFAAPFSVPAPTMIDVLLLAIAQNEAADFEADFIAINPLDWRRLQALKDNQGRYLANGPFSAEQVARLWQTAVVPTKGIAPGKFLVGDGQRGAQVFDRWQARIEVATEHADFFTRNMVMILAEERLALAVYKPNAFIYGDFTEAITAATQAP
ncbi:phage major capsid protein [Luteimonas aestuarii]|uniref:Phage major capsid protein n=1 Tax=Luteimonas aestuarii TaxID=453837 RepID=A0A4R5TM46_9GAMM|nr:phage major capsid protein [Luteimonas aestuarii]TDK23438.1 phage major capsid protein [Luteimonas aestuarii]